MTMTTKISWRDLRVTNAENEDCGKLGNLDPEDVSRATLNPDGSVESWPYIFLSAPGEEPEWDTPRVPVDWTGFREFWEICNALTALGSCPLCSSDEIEYAPGGDLEGFCRNCKEYFEVKP